MRCKLRHQQGCEEGEVFVVGVIGDSFLEEKHHLGSGRMGRAFLGLAETV